MGKSAPKPTPPKETSAAQTGTSVSTAVANAYLGNVDRIGPDGTTTYSENGSYTFTDPYTKQTYTIPRFKETVSLSPEQQAIYDQTKGTELNLASLAKNQSGFLQDYMAKPFSYSPGEHEKWALNLYDQMSADKLAQDDEALRTRLANQGIKAGSEAYNRELETMRAGTGKARNDFLLNSYQTGFGTAQAQRNQPINEITALMSGSQVSMPQFTGGNMPTIPTTDNAGIIANYDQQKLQAWQMEQAGLQNVLGGLFGLGAAGVYKWSDRRLKTDVKKVGETKDGQNIYSYRYKGDDTPQMGLMAQEVEKKNPEAVVTTPSGFKAVNYDRALGSVFGTGKAA